MVHVAVFRVEGAPVAHKKSLRRPPRWAAAVLRQRPPVPGERGRHHQTVLNTVEEWLVAVTNDPSKSPKPHVYHMHTNDFIVTGMGAWDYQKGVLNYTRIKADGTTRDHSICYCMRRWVKLY